MPATDVHIRVRRGLDVPIAGVPEQIIHEGPPVTSVALLGRDYPGLKPSVLVHPGERVRCGQPVMLDKSNPDVRFTAPAGGVVEPIHRGAHRVLRSVVIRLDGDDEYAQPFESFDPGDLAGLGRDRIVANLVASGQWTALRARPYGHVPAPDAVPAALFVTAIDTRPLAPDPAVVIAADAEAFRNGLAVLAALTEGPVWLCQAPDAEIPAPDHPRLRRARFTGPHPAGLPGTHIHFLHPVDATRSVWHVGYQDVIATGRLFTEGRLWTERVISIAGPVVGRPRLVRTRLGASTEDLAGSEHAPVECRVISGSCLSGHRAAGFDAYVGRYDVQVTVLAEGRERELFGWISPGLDKFSALPVFVSSLLGRGRRFALTTSQHGSPRAMVPIGVYERVVPLHVLATQLLRAIVVRDTEMAQALGCLEIEEEDLALCSFVCPGKYEFGPELRACLDQIEKEG